LSKSSHDPNEGRNRRDGWGNSGGSSGCSEVAASMCWSRSNNSISSSVSSSSLDVNEQRLSDRFFGCKKKAAWDDVAMVRVALRRSGCFAGWVVRLADVDTNNDDDDGIGFKRIESSRVLRSSCVGLRLLLRLVTVTMIIMICDGLDRRITGAGENANSAKRVSICEHDTNKK
jgi:hypothetical protein